MTPQEKAAAAVALLEEAYPQAVCSLEYQDPLQLLIATRLAAQCTDRRVNLVTPALFAHFPTAQAFAEAPVEAVEEDIRTCGLYKTKARDIVAMCQLLCREYDGRVPDTMEDLLRLPGVGRKTANLVLGDVFHQPAVVVDTHCIRITGRLGFHRTKDAVRIEKILRDLLPPEKSNDFCHRLVLHGRAVCTARSARCGQCPLSGICEEALSRQSENE